MPALAAFVEHRRPERVRLGLTSSMRRLVVSGAGFVEANSPRRPVLASAAGDCGRGLGKSIRAWRRAAAHVPRGTIASTLNSVPMPIRAGKPLDLVVQSVSRVAASALAPSRPARSSKPDAEQEIALRHEMRVEPVASRGLRKRGEIDMRGEVRLARIGERIVVAMLLTACSVSPSAGCEMAVVDEQAGAAMRRRSVRRSSPSAPCAPAQARRSRPLARCRRPAEAAPDRARRRRRRRRGRRLRRARPPLAPAPAGLHNWRIGTASKSSLPTMSSGRGGSVVDGLRASRAAGCVRQRGLLDLAQPAGSSRSWRSRAWLAKSGSSRASVRSMSFISVPRPGPISAIVDRQRPCRCVARRTQPDADQFAEHLADFRRGGEIAAAPNGSRVV